MQLSQCFHEVATEAESEGLRELAAKFGWSEDKVIVIAVNRMHFDIFYPNLEYDYPTEEELARWEKLGLIEKVPAKKAIQLEEFFKKLGVEDED